jgi:hypothetical protein
MVMSRAPAGINSVDDPACMCELRDALCDGQAAGHLAGLTTTDVAFLDGVTLDKGFVGRAVVGADWPGAELQAAASRAIAARASNAKT